MEGNREGGEEMMAEESVEICELPRLLELPREIFSLCCLPCQPVSCRERREFNDSPMNFTNYLTLENFYELDIAFLTAKPAIRQAYMNAIAGHVMSFPDKIIYKKLHRTVDYQRFIFNFYRKRWRLQDLRLNQHAYISLKTLEDQDTNRVLNMLSAVKSVYYNTFITTVPSPDYAISVQQMHKNIISYIIHLADTLTSLRSFVLDYNSSITVSSLKKILKNYPSITSLSIPCCRFLKMEKTLTLLTEFGQNISELNISYSSIHENECDKNVLIMVSSMPNLVSLNLSNTTISLKVLEKIIRTKSNWKELHLSNMRGLNCRNNDKIGMTAAITSLYTSEVDAFSSAIIVHGQQLKSLSLDYCYSLSEIRHIAPIINYAKVLEYISLSNSDTSITDITLYTISSSPCQNSLKSLNVQNCIRISDNGVIAIINKCKQLKFLAVDGCIYLTNAVLETWRCLKNSSSCRLSYNF